MRAGDEEPFLCWEDRLQASTRATGSGPRPGLPAHSSPALCLAKDPSSASPFPAETALCATCNHQGSSGPTRRPLPLAQPPWGGGEAGRHRRHSHPRHLGLVPSLPVLQEGCSAGDPLCFSPLTHSRGLKQYSGVSEGT